MSYLEMSDSKTGLFDTDTTEKKGFDLTARYNGAIPYPHIIINDFLPPAILEICLEQFPKALDKEGMTFDRPQERLKSSFNPDHLSSTLRVFFYSLNSKPFIRFLENLTGIRGLIPDPYFMGAGFHEIKNGGHLSVHADFNHHKPMNLERRINVLIYLNKDWKEEFGGQLELWDNDMKACQISVVPVFNRCVVFNTTSTSNHGNPNVVKHPQGIPRRSIALYYYTSTWTDDKREHTTHFQTRPGSQDKKDYQVRGDEALRDLIPPILYRAVKRATNKFMRK
jgi:Rps23 Pro-64 3,4-dihydroxylase Tpa1-like proline 4-hydroxylase